MYIRRRGLLLVLLLVLTAPVSASAQSATNKVPLTHETMWLMKRVGAPIPSPDGQYKEEAGYAPFEKVFLC